MSSTKSSRKRTAKASSDNAAISFDLLSSLTYMAALADGNPSRDILLRLTISQNYQTGIYFRQVYLLAKRMGFEYTRAFRMVARKAGASTVKNHLLRFAGAITAGVPEAEFLAQEVNLPEVDSGLIVLGYHQPRRRLRITGQSASICCPV